jgi:hypothetical protein
MPGEEKWWLKKLFLRPQTIDSFWMPGVTLKKGTILNPKDFFVPLPTTINDGVL